jgi:4-hydroxy-tetrahydrodipicolinate reductase
MRLCFAWLSDEQIVEGVEFLKHEPAPASEPAGTAIAEACLSRSTVVMINGLPGAMGTVIAEACLRRGFAIAPFALSGPGMAGQVNITDSSGGTPTAVQLVEGTSAEADSMLGELSTKLGPRLIVIDFTHPNAVNPNSALYQKHGAAFIMGTTGGDRDLLNSSTLKSGVYAVIASNMSKQIVALQAAMQKMGESFPGSFDGYTMALTESHQSTKADTSGTAKDMVKSFTALGPEFGVDDIQKIREQVAQREFGVPEGHLDGHAFHTYTLTSSDKTVEFQFKHNVCGRLTYAEGVADTVSFLASKVAAGSSRKLFSMIDVLEDGAMTAGTI